MIKINELAKSLLGEKSVAVICHVRPDGDAVGSVLGLTRALNLMGVKADAYCSDPIPPKFFYLEGAKDIKDKLCGEYSAFVAVDSAEKSRIGDFEKYFSKNSNCYNIDHHLSNPNYAKVNYVTNRPSNSENVFEIAKAFNCPIDDKLANILATGILTDTGNLSHKDVPSITFKSVGELVDLGANVNDINYRMFHAQSKARAKLFAIVMSRIKYVSDGKFAYAPIYIDDLKESGARRDETEGFIDFIMDISGVEVGASIMEMSENNFKISLRSKNADVSQVALRFGGGGHKYASGCQLQGEYEDVVDRLRYVVLQYIEE